MYCSETVNKKPLSAVALGGSRAVNGAQFTSRCRMRYGEKRQREKKPHFETLRLDAQPIKMIPRPKIRNHKMTGKWLRICKKTLPRCVCREPIRRLQDIRSIRIRIEMQQHSIRAINRPSLDVGNLRRSGGYWHPEGKNQDQSCCSKYGCEPG